MRAVKVSLQSASCLPLKPRALQQPESYPEISEGEFFVRIANIVVSVKACGINMISFVLEMDLTD